MVPAAPAAVCGWGVPGFLAGPSACGVGRTGPRVSAPGRRVFLALSVVESVMSLGRFSGGSSVLTIHTCVSGRVCLRTYVSLILGSL